MGYKWGGYFGRPTKSISDSHYSIYELDRIADAYVNVWQKLGIRVLYINNNKHITIIQILWW